MTAAAIEERPEAIAGTGRGGDPRRALCVRPESRACGKITHRIAISGGDQLGLVARLAEVFKQYEANIVRLEARKLPDAEGGLYVTRFAVSIPAGQADLCLATVSNTAGSLGLDCQVEESSL